MPYSSIRFTSWNQLYLGNSSSLSPCIRIYGGGIFCFAICFLLSSFVLNFVNLLLTQPCMAGTMLCGG
eukprot:c41103_g1_i1 orf=2-205(+)